jgi:nucleotide-binding universal stress UspA family protein
MAFITSKVVVGVDGSPASLRALWLAVEEARHRYVPIQVVHVGGDVGFSTVDGTTTAGSTDEGSAHRSRGMRVVEDALVELFGGVPADVPIRVTLAAPPVGPALVRAASEPDLLIVGRSRRGLARRLFLGSISAYCATHAPCPVVCVPRPEAPQRSYTPKGRQHKITRD